MTTDCSLLSADAECTEVVGITVNGFVASGDESSFVKVESNSGGLDVKATSDGSTGPTASDASDSCSTIGGVIDACGTCVVVCAVDVNTMPVGNVTDSPAVEDNSPSVSDRA